MINSAGSRSVYLSWIYHNRHGYIQPPNSESELVDKIPVCDKSGFIPSGLADPEDGSIDRLPQKCDANHR